MTFRERNLVLKHLELWKVVCIRLPDPPRHATSAAVAESIDAAIEIMKHVEIKSPEKEK